VATTLFRSNSAASKLLSLTLKTMGMQYIHSLLQQPVAQICSDPSLHVEIDPRRFKPTDSTEANVAKLTNLCRQFLQRILRSVDECPLYVVSPRKNINWPTPCSFFVFKKIASFANCAIICRAGWSANFQRATR